MNFCWVAATDYQILPPLTEFLWNFRFIHSQRTMRKRWKISSSSFNYWQCCSVVVLFWLWDAIAPHLWIMAQHLRITAKDQHKKIRYENATVVTVATFGILGQTTACSPINMNGVFAPSRTMKKNHSQSVHFSIIHLVFAVIHRSFLVRVKSNLICLRMINISHDWWRLPPLSILCRNDEHLLTRTMEKMLWK